ncbi:chorismate synthase, partial [mine drainage metagenome]
NLAAAFKDTINAMRFHGGLVCAAYDGEEMVGMQFSFPGFRRGKTYLYSHMTGIIEEKEVLRNRVPAEDVSEEMGS